MRGFIRVLIALVVLIGAANTVGGFVRLHDNGTFGFAIQPLAEHQGTLAVGTVAAGSPAAAAGLHNGDRIEYAPTFETRVAIASLAPGDRVTFLKNGRPFEMTAATDESPVPWALLIATLISKLAFLAIAVLIAFRRPHDNAALALSLFLACFGAGIDYDFVIFPALLVRFMSFVFVQLAFVTGGAAVLAFASWFPEPSPTGMRAFLSKCIVPLATIGLVATIAAFVSSYVLANRELARAFSSVYLFNYLLLISGTITALFLSYAVAVREQRARMRWVLGVFLAGFSGITVLFIALVFNVNAPWTQYVSLTVLAIPFGLGYVILRHRVLDIGFVVNRAVVYTGVSLVVVGAFIVFEWLLAHLVENNTRASTIIQLGGALALGLSVRFIHARVDRYVDDLFFRERHLAEAAIRRFAHETGLITDADVLVKRAVEVVERNARVLGAAFYARLGARYVPLYSTFAATPSELSENDETILDMRTWRQPVENGAESSVPGALALPMVVRGELSGFLACGEKLTHEAFAPDERDALRVLARDAGVALDSLRIASIERELAYLSADGELPPEVRVRLSSLLHPDDAAQPAGARARSIQ